MIKVAQVQTGPEVNFVWSGLSLPPGYVLMVCLFFLCACIHPKHNRGFPWYLNCFHVSITNGMQGFEVQAFHLHLLLKMYLGQCTNLFHLQ